MIYAEDKFRIVWANDCHDNQNNILASCLVLISKTDGLWWCRAVNGTVIAINPLSPDIHAILLERDPEAKEII